LYSDADIILLDDPLSAVDAHVGKHLFEKAIKDYWKEKLIILATNQLQYLPYADNIIFLSDGEVVATGKFDELMSNTPAFKEQMNKYGVTGAAKEEEKKEEKKEVKAAEKAGPEQSTYLTKLFLSKHFVNFLL
jgi:ATP-binding cassette subfamily C (CFTR/MRP) protein 1